MTVVGWLSEQTRTGLREMPSNAAWMVSRVLRPAESAGSATGSAAPVGGDSVDVRMRRAREATERAREAEEEALEATQESNQLAANARQLSERGNARIRD